MTRANFPMPFKAPLLLILPALTAVLHAGVPQKQPLGNYANLWTNSPFTAKPPVAGAAPVANPLEDYALLGVSPIGNNGYRVTLINKKQADQRITVETGKASPAGFSITKVNREAGQPLKTTVEMASGSMQGTVSFDEKLLAIAAPPPPAPTGQAPGQVQPQIQGQPGAPGQVIQKQPRPRVVPPPAPGNPNFNPAAAQPQGQPNQPRPFNRRR
jgi:hypothetical protein